jgi:hypothetical protein
MATNTFVEIDIPEALHLADLSGIVHDFEGAKYFATQLKEMLARNPPEYSLVEPMTTAILVRYSRPFTTGVRRRIKEEDLETLSPEQRETHDHFRLWRDKHIAHSVNVFEENQPVARYWVERFDDEGFTSIECNQSQLIGMSLNDVEMVIELATHFIEELKLRLKREKEKVLAVVQSLPKQQVLGMAKPAHAPNVNDVAKVRKR